MQFHSPKTFICNGFKEPSTWVGIAIIVFGWIFRLEIHTLIHNVLMSPALANSVITGANVIFYKVCDVSATAIGGILILRFSSKDKSNYPKNPDSSNLRS
jgi:hypothetical protein